MKTQVVFQYFRGVRKKIFVELKGRCLSWHEFKNWSIVLSYYIEICCFSLTSPSIGVGGLHRLQEEQDNLIP